MSPARMPRSGCAAGSSPGSSSSAATTGSISVTGATIRQPPPSIDTWCHSTVCAAFVSLTVSTDCADEPTPNAALRAAHALAATIAMSDVTSSARAVHANNTATSARIKLFFIGFSVLFRQAQAREVYTSPKTCTKLYTESVRKQMKKFNFLQENFRTAFP